MFFSDKPTAFSEARRVLKPGGLFLLAVWDTIEENEFADVVTRALEPVLRSSSAGFLRRTPHGYSDSSEITRDLSRAGFTESPSIERIEARSRAASPMLPAVAYSQGTPLRNEIEAGDKSLLAAATNIAARAIEDRFGSGAVDGKIQALIVSVRKDG
jgi:hypothetical protein